MSGLKQFDMETFTAWELATIERALLRQAKAHEYSKFAKKRIEALARRFSEALVARTSVDSLWYTSGGSEPL